MAKFINVRLYPLIDFLNFTLCSSNNKTSSLRLANAKNKANKKVIKIIHMLEWTWLTTEPENIRNKNPIAMIYTSIKEKYQPYLHIGNVRQVAKILSIQQIKTNNPKG